MQDLKQNIFTINNAIDLFVEQNNRMQKPLKTEYEYLKWLDEGRMIVIGGGSGLGKTAYVLQMAYELAKNNKDDVISIYASSEMMIEELTMRLLVNQSVLSTQYNITNIRQQFNSLKVNEDTLKTNIFKAKKVLEKVPFYFLNSSQFTLNHIIETIRLTREKNKDKRIFVVIDYLQLLLLGGDLKDKEVMIKRLKDTLVEYRANAIVISALNRDSTKNNYVDMSAFKDSSMIEYTTDIGILFCYEDEKGNYTLKNENGNYDDTIQFSTKCVKNRVGKHFVDDVEFNKLQQRFEFLEDNDILKELEVKENQNNALDITIEKNRVGNKEIESSRKNLIQKGLKFE